jgi:hypothetical protein
MRLVEPAHLINDLRSSHHCADGDEAALKKGPAYPTLMRLKSLTEAPKDPPSFTVECYRVGVYQAYGQVVLEEVDLASELGRKPKVVAIQERNQLARCCHDPSVPCCTFAGVRLPNHPYRSAKLLSNR